jgi:hypothetical protein
VYKARLALRTCNRAGLIPNLRLWTARPNDPEFKNGSEMHGGLARLDASAKPAEFQFERPDWTLFRSVGTLSQRAGVPQNRLRRLVLKELVDNALDAGGSAKVGSRDENPYYVEDNGPGIDGTPEDIARLFSINRPLVSSKLLRRPTRGAFGNGLRAVVGAVVASDGRLQVWTRNQQLVLTPQDDGSTAVEAFEADFSTGTRIEITLGPTVPHDPRPLNWAQWAILMARGGEGYRGKPSPWWYDGDHFYELLQAGGVRPVRDLIANLDGCSGPKAGQIAEAFRNTPCNAMSRQQAVDLLHAARDQAKKVRPERLGSVGLLDALPSSYAVERGTFRAGGRDPKAEIPFVVEAWIDLNPDRDTAADLVFHINRSPITGQVRCWGEKGELTLYGCGLSHEIDTKRGDFTIVVNVTTPYCPITTDGKEPDLACFEQSIHDAIKRAAGSARRALPKTSASPERLTQKAVILDRLNEGITKASGDSQFRFNQRQLFYVLRPFVIEALGVEPSWDNFCAIITDYENQHGDIRGMYRDPRGTLYHPHLGQDISLGTLAVEEYRRPTWTFNKVLYIEKEGFFEALKAARWPERHDCALLTSKGFTTRAVRDLLDLLGDDGEPVQVFCAHDADAFGTMIYQTLQEETKARPRRRSKVVNLGLDPWEAEEMGLPTEQVKDRERRVAVADYIASRPDGDHWVEWLTTKRVELNAMTTRALIEWLDTKMAQHEGVKVVPPAAVMITTMTEAAAGHIRRDITDRVLRKERIEDQVATVMTTITMPNGDDLVQDAEAWLAKCEHEHWTDYVEGVARYTVARRLGPGSSPDL